MELAKEKNNTKVKPILMRKIEDITNLKPLKVYSRGSRANLIMMFAK
jgi:hypothetical protein